MHSIGDICRQVLLLRPREVFISRGMLFVYSVIISLFDCPMFWNQWPLSYRLFFWLIFLFMLSALGLWGYSHYLGDANVIEWQINGKAEPLRLLTEQIGRSFFNFSVSADIFLVTETFGAGDLVVPRWPYVVFGLIFLVGAHLLLTAATDLPRIGYLAAIGIWIFTLARMNLSELRVLTEYGESALFVGLLSAYIVVSYIFHAFWTSVHPFWRFMAYNLIAAGGGYVALNYSYAPQNDPLVHVVAHSTLMPVLCFAIFCLLVGHEVVRGIFWFFAARSGSPTRSREFIGMTLIYLANLLYGYLLFAEVFGNLGNLYHIPALYFFPVSAVLGLWGFRQMESWYGRFFRFAPTGAVMYVGLMLLATASLGFSTATANSPMIGVYHTLILVTHFGMGLGFMAYAFVNFGDFMNEGKPVWKVIFQPSRLPFVMSLMVGGLIAIGMLVADNLFVYNQMIAGEANQMGDMEWRKGDLFEAKSYYAVGYNYDFRNHRTYYSLGTMARQQGDLHAALSFFVDALKREPSPYAYVAIADLQTALKAEKEALNTLRYGVERFPRSMELTNNLAMTYWKLDRPDSAFLCFEQWRNRALPWQDTRTTTANQIALLAASRVYDRLDTVFGQQPDWQEHLPTLANEAAFRAVTGQPVSSLQTALVPDSLAGLPALCYLYNTALASSAATDSLLLNKITQQLYRPENAQYSSMLLLAKANLHDQRRDYAEAFKIMAALYDQNHSSNPYYAHLLGLRLIAAGRWKEAAYYLGQAAQRGQPEAALQQAIALAEAGLYSDAVSACAQIRQLGNPEEKAVAMRLLRCLVTDSLPPAALAKEDELTCFQYLHYQNLRMEDAAFDQVYGRLKNPDYQIQALSERILRYTRQNDLLRAGTYFARLLSLKPAPATQYTFDRAWIAYMALRPQADTALLSTIQRTNWPPADQGWKAYYTGWVHENQNLPGVAEPQYREAIRQLPYEEQPYLRLAALLQAKGERQKAYEVLLSGVTTNRQSAALLQAYIRAALKLNLTTFAAQGMETLQFLIPASEWADFQKIYEQDKAEAEAATAAWQ